MQKLLLAASGLALSSAAGAHSGHHDGAVLQTLAHIWTHVDHWLPAVALLSAVIASGALLRARKVSRSSEYRREE